MGKISLADVGKLSYLRQIMLDIDAFKSEASAYCHRAGIKLATLGAYAVGDKTVFSRLDRGGNVGVVTLKRILDYMADNPRAGTDGGAAAGSDLPETDMGLPVSSSEEDAA